MTVIEIVKQLRELERVLRRIRGLRLSRCIARRSTTSCRHAATIPRSLASRQNVSRNRCRAPAPDSGSITPPCGRCWSRAPPRTAHTARSRLRSQRFLEVERDHRILGELQHEVTQRADRDLRRRSRGARLRPAPDAACPLPSVAAAISSSIRSSAFTPNPLRPLTPRCTTSPGLLRKPRSPVHRAARRERHHLVGKMRVVVRLFGVAQQRESLQFTVSCGSDWRESITL